MRSSITGIVLGLLVSAGCGSGGATSTPDGSPTAGDAMASTTGDASPPGDAQDPAADAIARAEQWVAVKLQYCQAPNHQRDYDDACTTYCNRYDDPAWDPYRSDCSGLISWAWGLPAPGRTTYEFAPFETDITSVIDASTLRPADAVNNADHVMLFKEWVVAGQRAIFIEEPGCATAITYAHEVDSTVTLNGSSIHVDASGMTFSAIRYNALGSTCVVGGAYCGGDKLQGDPSTLYRCNGTNAPTVIQQCANGCSVVPGQDDACS